MQCTKVMHSKSLVLVNAFGRVTNMKASTFLRMSFPIMLMAFIPHVYAEDAASSLAETSPLFESVEERISLMDTNKDGIVTVYEVRAYIESLHSKNYQKEALDDMVSSASGKSCSTPFAKSLYSK